MTPHETPLRLRDGRSVACRETDSDGLSDLLLAAPELAPHLEVGRRIALGSGAPRVEIGLAALSGDPEAPVAAASITHLSGAAEGGLDLAVRPDWRGVGLGTAMLEQAVDRAGEAGIEALWLRVPVEARQVVARLHELGAHLEERHQGDHVLVRISTSRDEDLLRAEAERFSQAAATSLQPMFSPRAIAVVGASHRPGAPGGAAFRGILAAGFPGPVYPVNRTGGEVAGHPAYTSLREIGGPVDLVVVAVPATAVTAVAHDAIAVGARAMVVISSGFAEAGPEGAALEAELLHVARTGGLRVLGPNCLGLAVNDPRAPFDATFGPGRPPPGRMAFASQSGGLGIGALAFCAARGIGLSSFVSLGNSADLSPNDLLGYWSHDERTRVVLLYLEGFGNPRRFARLARTVARRTPVVALKGGRSAAGTRAAASHTAALAAGDAPADAMFRLAGVVRVDTVEELFETGQVLADQPLPAGARVAVVSNAGGPGILAADACAGHGLEVPAFPEALQERIRARAPATAGAANPVDLGARARPADYTAAIREIAEEGVADAVVAIHTPTRGGDPDAVVRAVQAESFGRMTVVGCLLGDQAPPAPAQSTWPVPWLGFPETAARALARAVDAGRFARRPDDPPVALADVDAHAGHDALASAAPGAWLDPEAVEALLGAYGLRVARGRVARSPHEAAAAQAQLGVTAAVKLVSATVLHKTEVGGVELGCDTPDAAARAYRRISERAEAAAGRGAMEGVLVQEQAPAGLDVIVGAMSDPVFGPLVLAGMGGVQAELWGDRALALAPVGPAAAAGLWAGLRGARLIDGYRGAAPADREALVDVVLRVGRLAHEQGLLAEMDLNPVRALAPGGGAVVLDARVRRA